MNAFILLLSSLFPNTALAEKSRCEVFVGLKKFTATPIDDRSRLSAINEYLNMTQATDRHLPKNIVDKKKNSALAMQFQNPSGKKITLIFIESGHIVSIIEENKVLYCEDDPRKKSSE